MIRQITIFLTITAVGIAQPDLKFDPFDWIQYRQVGKVIQLHLAIDLAISVHSQVAL